MSDDLFPNAVRGLTWTIARTPEFNTIVQTSPSFVETAIIQAQNPRRRWELKYDYIKDYDVQSALTPYTDFATLEAFFLSHYGQGVNFLFQDIWTPDYYQYPALSAPATPNLACQLQLVQDANTSIWYSPVQLKRGGTWYEDVDWVNTTDRSLYLYDNGVSVPIGPPSGSNAQLLGPGLAISGYSFAGMYFKWHYTPTGPITAQFHYNWRVKFDEDQQSFEKFMNALWTAGDRGGASIKLRSARAYAGAA